MRAWLLAPVWCASRVGCGKDLFAGRSGQMCAGTRVATTETNFSWGTRKWEQDGETCSACTCPETAA